MTEPEAMGMLALAMPEVDILLGTAVLSISGNARNGSFGVVRVLVKAAPEVAASEVTLPEIAAPEEAAPAVVAPEVTSALTVVVSELDIELEVVALGTGTTSP